MLGLHRRREAHAVFVRVEGVVHLGIAEDAEQAQPTGGIVDAVAGLARRQADAVDDPEATDHQRVEVARLDEGELVQSDGPAGEQDLAEGAVLLLGARPKRLQRLGVDEFEGAEQLAQVPVAGVEIGRTAESHREDRRLGRLPAGVGQVAQLAAVPLAHVGQVLFDLFAPFENLVFFQAQLFHAPGEVEGGGVRFLRGGCQFRLLEVDARFAVPHRRFQFVDAGLPIVQLLAELGDGQAVLPARHFQRLLSTTDVFAVLAELLPQSFERLPALFGIAVQLGELAAQHVPRGEQFVEQDSRMLLEFGCSLQQPLRLAARFLAEGRDLVPFRQGFFEGQRPLGLPFLAGGVEFLATPGHALADFAQAGDLALESSLTLGHRRGSLVKRFFAPLEIGPGRIPRPLDLALLLLKLRVERLQGLSVGGELQGRVVHVLCPLPQVVGAPAQLLLELPPGRIRIRLRALALADRPPVGFQSRLQVEDLRHFRLQDRGLLGHVRTAGIELLAVGFRADLERGQFLTLGGQLGAVRFQ